MAIMDCLTKLQYSICPLALAHGHLVGRHSHERVLRAWADTSKTPLDDYKQQMGHLLTEFLSSVRLVVQTTTLD